MNRFLLVSAVAALCGAPACTVERSDSAGPHIEYAAYVDHVISVADVQAASDSGRALIDLWTPGYGYSVEGGMDYGAIDVICPSGRFMTLEQLANEAGAPLDEELFLFSSDPSTSQFDWSPCDEPDTGCFWHTEPGRTRVCLCY